MTSEPVGLGAVVEDVDGTLWLSNRFDPNIQWTTPWWSADLGEYRDFHEIEVAHVRSQGYLAAEVSA